MKTLEEKFTSITATHSIGQALPAVLGSIHGMKTALYKTAAFAKTVIKGDAIDS